MVICHRLQVCGRLGSVTSSRRKSTGHDRAPKLCSAGDLDLHRQRIFLLRRQGIEVMEACSNHAIHGGPEERIAVVNLYIVDGPYKPPRVAGLSIAPCLADRQQLKGADSMAFKPNSQTRDQAISDALKESRVRSGKQIITSWSCRIRKVTEALLVSNVLSGFKEWQLSVYIDGPSQPFLLMGIHSHAEGGGVPVIVDGWNLRLPRLGFTTARRRRIRRLAGTGLLERVLGR